MHATLHRLPAQPERAILAGSLAGMSLVAWASLLAWTESPLGAYLGHDAGDAVPVVLQAALFTAGWTLMILAMMLPSSIPLVLTFGALVRLRPRPGLLVALLLAGYLGAWTTFGFAAWILDRGVHAAVDALPWLAANQRLILGGALLAAGLWQLSPLRDRCLDACRTPLGFVVARWRGTRPRTEALAMGLAHGAFCIGCCWSLMLVMFGVGVGGLGVMLGIGAVTAVEKNAPWGRRLSRPLGVILILAAVYVTSA